MDPMGEESPFPVVLFSGAMLSFRAVKRKNDKPRNSVLKDSIQKLQVLLPFHSRRNLFHGFPQWSEAILIVTLIFFFNQRAISWKLAKFGDLENRRKKISIRSLDGLLWGMHFSWTRRLVVKWRHHFWSSRNDTVEGSEIRRSPADMLHIPLFTRFYTSQVVV